MPAYARPLRMVRRAWRAPSNVRDHLSSVVAKPPISNKLFRHQYRKIPSRSPSKRTRAFGALGFIMRHPFAVPGATPSRPTLLGVVVLTILVFGVFALLKSTSDGTQAPANELITGSIPRAAPVRKPPSNDQMSAFLSPTSTQLTHPRTKHGGRWTCPSVAAPTTQTAVISRAMAAAVGLATCGRASPFRTTQGRREDWAAPLC